MDHDAAGGAGLTRWDQQVAKAKFSEVVRRARSEGPQLVTTRGAKPVVIVPAEDYFALLAKRKMTFDDLLMPGDGLETVRDNTPAIERPSELWAG